MAQDDNYQSADSFDTVHTPDEIADDPNLQNNNGDPETPEDKADDFNEGADKDTNIDKLHKEAFGDEDTDTIGNEITKDDVAYEHGINPDEEKKKIKKSGI